MEKLHVAERSELGRIAITSEAIAQIVGNVAAECYGVVGMAGRSRLPRLRGRSRLTNGIGIRARDDALDVDLRVVVEYGLNLAEVAATLRSRVAYEVERMTGLKVASIDVRIDDVRRS